MPLLDKSSSGGYDAQGTDMIVIESTPARSRTLSLLGFILAGMVLFSGCRLGARATASPTEIALEESDTAPAVSPGQLATLSSPTPVEQVETAYPGPGEGAPPVVAPVDTAYPGPGVALPTQDSSFPADGYPPPGGSATGGTESPVSPTSTRSAGSTVIPGPTEPSGAYPDPGSGEGAPLLPGGEYPGPGGTEGAPPFTITPAFPPTGSSPGQTAIPTVLTPSPPGESLSPTPGVTETVTDIPTLTPLDFVVFTGFKPTDPTEVNLASGKVQLVEFYAEWSLVSQSMAPVVHALEARYKDRIDFVYLNVEDPATRDLKAKLGYTLITRPHFFLIDGSGNILAEWVGFVSEAEFIAAFEQAAPSPGGNG